MTTKVGVLAVQGDFAEHIAVLKYLAVEGHEVRLPADMEELHALIIPGGESTTLSYLMDLYGLKEPITQRVAQGMPLWGTCAGMIMMAHNPSGLRPTPMGLMDIDVVRNAHGRQVDSFEADIIVKPLNGEPFHAVFIRAPAISRVGPSVEVLARLQESGPVAVKQDNLLATAFHPELTSDTRFHRYFVELIKGGKPAQ